MTELIGWIACGLLLITFGSQTYMQWKGQRDKYTILFFVTAILGSAGNALYSFLVHNIVFIVLNAALVVNNSVGFGIALHNHAKKKKSDSNALRG
jgi:hypothetical protein